MFRRCALAALATGCQEYDLINNAKGEVYFQPEVDARADVLFVVDDSASMQEEQERLAANFLSFVDALEASDADWQMGIVTTSTDAPDAGFLRGGAFTPDTAGLEAAVTDALLVGSEGARDEKGFDAAILAADGRNRGFPRVDARFNVVFVSDEDDRSAGTTAQFLGWLAALKVDGAAAHGVVGDMPAGCASGTGAGEAGPRYDTVITATDGFRDSICAGDYSDLLTRVGFEAAGLPDTFPLADVPRSDTLVVLVDGVTMPERELDGWTYDPGANAVVFHGRAIPRPGMQIGFEYVPLLGAD